MTELEKALKAKDEFLRLNPHLQPLQDEIDQSLDRCGNDTLKRLMTIRELLRFSLSELASSAKELEEKRKLLESLK